MITMPFISVVIPFYNAEDWVAEAIESIFSQSYPHQLIEIILVDDGSNDDTSTIAQNLLKNGNIAWQIKQIANAGPSRARNVGWQSGKGDWIQFLDADDLLDPDKLNYQAAIANKSTIDVASIYSDWQYLFHINNVWQKQFPPRTPMINLDPVADLLTDNGFVHIGAQLFSRLWLEKVGGFDERHWLIEDVDLMLRLAMAGGKYLQAISDKPLFFYRRNVQQSLSQRNEREFIDGCVRNAQLAEKFWEDKNDLTIERKEVVVAVYYQAARFYAGVDKEQFEQLVKKLEILQPGFVPPGPFHLRQLSKMVGYSRAESIAHFYRRIKHLLPGRINQSDQNLIRTGKSNK